jgi:hypothetical protein
VDALASRHCFPIKPVGCAEHLFGCFRKPVEVRRDAKQGVDLGEGQEFALAAFDLGQTGRQHLAMPVWGWHSLRRSRERSPEQFHRLEPFLQTHLFNIRCLNHAAKYA